MISTVFRGEVIGLGAETLRRIPRVFIQISAQFGDDPAVARIESSKVRKNLRIFAAERLHICRKTRTMRRLLGPARVKACLPLFGFYTEL